MGVFDGKEDPRDDLAGCFLRLKNLTITEVHARWDIAYLEEYIKENMVPRSLRWEVNPQKEDNELGEWFKYFNEAGVGFLQFLVAKKKRKLTMLDLEINTIRSKLAPFKDDQEYIRRSEALKTILIKEEMEQKQKKRRKYNRDIKDYKDNLVFKWQIPPSSDPPVTNSTTSNLQTMPSTQEPRRENLSMISHNSPHPRGRVIQQYPNHIRGRGRSKGSLPQTHYNPSPSWRQYRGDEAHYDYDGGHYLRNQRVHRGRQRYGEGTAEQEQQGQQRGISNRFSPLAQTMEGSISSPNGNQHIFGPPQSQQENNRFRRDFQVVGRGRTKRNGDAREGAEGGGNFTPKRRRL